jgi:dipeptidyl aminopeptidase/acylaminoacyl peptidase
MRLRAIAIAAAVLAAVATAAAQTAPAPAPAGPTVDQLIGLKRAGSPAISPDGKLVAYTVREANWDENAYETEIWIADVATGANRQLTSAKKSSGAPKWSPDGSRIAFTSDRSDKQQIWLIRPSFGEAEQLTHESEGVGSFAWSPDGTRIAFTMTDPKSEAWKDRDKKYGDFEAVDEDQRLTHLWVIDVESKKTKRLTKGAFTANNFDWSPDGKAIAFDHAVNPDPATSGTYDISVVTVADGAIRPLVTQAGPDNRPLWSPDGTRIAFTSAMAQPFYYYANNRIAVIPAAGGAITDLTKNFDENPAPIAWLKDGIVFSASQKTAAHLFRLDPATQAVTKLTPGDQWIFSGASTTAGGGTMAFIRTGPKEFPEVWVVSAMTGTLRKLTDLGAQVASWPQPSQEVITWKSVDGALIEGVLHKPATFKPGTRYPLLIVIHGGPTGISRPMPFSSTTTYPIDIWLN